MKLLDRTPHAIRKILGELKATVELFETWQQAHAAFSTKLSTATATNFSHLWEAEYKRTRNPLFAWWTYRFYRSAQQPTPKWVFAYFDEASGNIARLLSTPRKATAVAVAEALALKLKGKGGRGTVFTRFKHSMRDLQLHSEVQVLLTEKVGPHSAKDSIALRFNSTINVVKKATRRRKPSAGASRRVGSP